MAGAGGGWWRLVVAVAAVAVAAAAVVVVVVVVAGGDSGQWRLVVVSVGWGQATAAAAGQAPRWRHSGGFGQDLCSPPAVPLPLYCFPCPAPRAAGHRLAVLYRPARTAGTPSPPGRTSRTCGRARRCGAAAAAAALRMPCMGRRAEHVRACVRAVSVGEPCRHRLLAHPTTSVPSPSLPPAELRACPHPCRVQLGTMWGIFSKEDADKIIPEVWGGVGAPVCGCSSSLLHARGSAGPPRCCLRGRAAALPALAVAWTTALMQGRFVSPEARPTPLVHRTHPLACGTRRASLPASPPPQGHRHPHFSKDQPEDDSATASEFKDTPEDRPEGPAAAAERYGGSAAVEGGAAARGKQAQQPSLRVEPFGGRQQA